MARFLLFLALLITPLYAAPPAIKLTAPGTIGKAPLTFDLRITLEPDERNRQICLHVQQTRGGDHERLGCWEVDAEREPRTTWKRIKDLDAGEWDITASVIRNDEKSTLSNRVTMQVFGLGYEPPPTQ